MKSHNLLVGRSVVWSVNRSVSRLVSVSQPFGWSAGQSDGHRASQSSSCSIPLSTGSLIVAAESRTVAFGPWSMQEW